MEFTEDTFKGVIKIVLYIAIVFVVYFPSLLMNKRLEELKNEIKSLDTIQIDSVN